MSVKMEKHRAMENKINGKSTDPLFDKLPDHVLRMWELPQIYEFLCFAKDTLHIENLSMYEMERMLSMPRASKQLANIMTCLLSSSVPRSRLIKIPPMPYEFWTNVLLNHKVNNWLRVYESKEHDSIKVLDSIGVEPEFWTIFPDISAINQCKFEELNLRQRVWLLKTLCDTMMHGKKSLQDEVANRYLDGEGEKILGRDRHGARYIYFPIYLDNDLRVYKHNINNKIMLNVISIAPKLRIHARRVYNRRDRRRKKSRWKNGNLPQKQKKRPIKVVTIDNDDVKFNIKVEQSDEKTHHSNNSNSGSCTIEQLHGDVKTEVDEKSRTIINLDLILKPTDIEKNDGQSHPDNVSSSSKTDDEKINDIMTIPSSDSSVVCTSKINNGVISKSDDEKLIETKIIVDNNDKNEKVINNNDCLSDRVGLNTWMKALLANNDVKDDIKEYHDENAHDNFTESNDSIRTRSKTICNREMKQLNNILMDLGVSAFELVADSVESLKELISTLTAQNSSITSGPVRCEMLLIKKLKALIVSLKSKESVLRESKAEAKRKLEREWNNFNDGINDDKVSNCTRYSSEWVLGSQGCPLLSCSDTFQNDEDGNDHDKAESERDEDDEAENETRDKTETRRVLRARGVSSYMEQFTSDDDTDSSQPEGWAEIVDPTTGIHLGMSAVQADGAPEDDDESDGSGSDQDWILPRERKRKSKRISANRRFKTLQNKLQTNEVDVKNIESTSSLDMNNRPRKIYPKNTLNSIKIESVHSEYHIKDEALVVDPPTTITNAIIGNNNTQQNYVLHQVVNTRNGPMNYVVMPNDSAPIAQTSGVVSIMPQVPMQPGYYIQNPQGYVVSNSPLTQVRTPFVNQQNISSVHGVLIQPNQQYVASPSNYVQYQQLGVARSVPLYPSSMQSEGINQPLRLSLQSPKLQPRIVQNRQIVPPYRPRHPVGAVIRSTVPFRAEIRPPPVGKSRGGKIITPRNATLARNIRPTKRNVGNSSNQNDSIKTTSLIVLSDSDDEIEMIIPQKKNEIGQKQMKNNNSSLLQSKTVDNDTPAAVSATVNDNEQSSSQAILTPQIIQRMSQGGISITPIKPKTSVKSSAISATQLVVVVNETGSHYALALPNGSKLILTPEQVAQIRASNGGKLVL